MNHSNDHKSAHRALMELANVQKAPLLARFFKTGPGEYGEGDQFLGIMVPSVRKLVARFSDLSFPDISRLLASQFNEERLLALLILVHRYEHGTESEKDKVFKMYLRHLGRVNNWNLVDASAPYIVGAHLSNRSRRILYRLARSSVLWHRRVAVVSTFHFIRSGEFHDTLKLSVLLMGDPHDLMHKACGWMLREVGKRDVQVLEKFVRRYQANMPRTMLRYAIERFPRVKRLRILKDSKK